MESINTPKEGRKHDTFAWDSLGDIKEGRGELGEEMPVLVYRLLQFTLLDILSKAHGHELANEYFRQAGHLAGSEFARHALNINARFDTFMEDLQMTLKNLKIGILNTEKYDPETGSIVLTVEKDLDCSGLPNTEETVCNYDEGFISGILEFYSGKKYHIREIDCWASGDKLCRFSGVARGT